MSEIQQSIKSVIGRGIVVAGNDIDTDQIIPARFMKVVTFEGIGEYAFYDLRYDAEGRTKPHPFNDSTYAGASVMIVNKNFGCGSSREHAPQALMRYGIKAIVGESFAEIFAGNCTAMGIPTLTMSHEEIETIADQVRTDPSLEIAIDLPSSSISIGDESRTFAMAPAYRSALIAGSWDSTSLLLTNLDEIAGTAGALPYLNDFSVSA